MINLLKTRREGLHGLKVGHIARGDEIGVRLPVKAPNAAALGEETFGNSSSDAASGSDDGDRLILEVEIHAAWRKSGMQARISVLSRDFLERRLP
jgi:hypothetical protein